MNTKRHHVKDFTVHIKNICSLLQIPLLEIPAGDKKKRNVVSLITISNGTVNVESHAVYTKEEISEEDAQRLKLTLINAEDYFIENNKLWVGDIKKVFSDYSITLENKYGQLVWCGTPYRSTMEEFYVDLNHPVMVTTYYVAALEKLSAGKGLIELSQMGISTDEQRRFILNDLKEIKRKVKQDEEAQYASSGPVSAVTSGPDKPTTGRIDLTDVGTVTDEKSFFTTWGRVPKDIDAAPDSAQPQLQRG